MAKEIVSRRRFMIAASSAAAAAGLPTQTQAQAPIVMKLGIGTINDVQHEWMKLYTAAVEKDSGGRIKGEMYPANQLGPTQRQIEGTQFGQIQGNCTPPEFLAGIDPRYQVLSAPGLFKSADHLIATLSDPQFNAAFLGLGADKGLKGVSLLMYAPACINTRQPVTTLADLKGLKIRVLASPLQMEQVRRLGAAPVPMPLGDVLPALQQGAIDGVLSATPALATFRYYDAAKYILATEQFYLTSVATLSKRWFDRLPGDLRKVITENGAKVSGVLYDFAKTFNQKQDEVWRSGGGEIRRLSDKDQAHMTQLLAPIGDEIFKDKPEVQQFYNLLVATAKRRG